MVGPSYQVTKSFHNNRDPSAHSDFIFGKKCGPIIQSIHRRKTSVLLQVLDNPYETDDPAPKGATHNQS